MLEVFRRVLKSQDITLLTKFHLVKAMGFPVLMYECESWTIKKTECRRTDAFELWCWRRLLRVPWTAGRSNQSILKEINPEYSLEGLMLKLTGLEDWSWNQYFGHLMQRADSFEKTLMLGKMESRRRRGRQRMRCRDGTPNQWTWVWENFRSRQWTERPGMLQSMGSQRVEHDWMAELNWKYILTYKPADGNNRSNNNTHLSSSVLNALHTLFQLITVTLYMLPILSSSPLPLIFLQIRNLRSQVVRSKVRTWTKICLDILPIFLRKEL